MGQEYPATPEEAFSATNSERFLPSILWWDQCTEGIPQLDEDTPVVFGVDAGVSNDYFALVAVSRHPERHHDVAARLVRVWEPKGVPLDFTAIEGEIAELCDFYNVKQIAYDQTQLHQMMTNLGRRIWTKVFSQQGDRAVADKQLLDLIQARRLAHDGTWADLRQALDNADRAVDSTAHKLRIVKRKDDLKIDAAVACSMAVARCLSLNL